MTAIVDSENHKWHSVHDMKVDIRSSQDVQVHNKQIFVYKKPVKNVGWMDGWMSQLQIFIFSLTK